MKKLYVFAMAVAALVACNPDNEVQKEKPATKSDFSKLVINEAYPTAPSDAEKFVELYNGGDAAVSLEGVVIKRTDETNATEEVWLGISGETVPAKGYFVIQGTKRSLERSLSSGLSAKKGVKLEVFDPDGKSITSVQHGDPTADGAPATKLQTGVWARIPDGGAWKNVTNPTPGKANDATGAQDDPELK
jgi:hypothetical protein